MNAAAWADPHDSFAARVAAYLEVGALSANAIENVATEVNSVGAGPSALPVTVNRSEFGNAWICSPHTTYALYTREEIGRFAHPLLTRPLRALCAPLGACLRHAGIDHTVAVNNWLISTNLYPPARAYNVPTCIAEAVERWPRHAVWFRSLNARYTPDWLRSLIDAGCILIPSRQVYLYDGIEPTATRPVDLQRDFRLLRTTELTSSPASNWSASDFERAACLYALLYIDKYSKLNPSYSAEFLRLWHNAGLLDLVGYRAPTGSCRPSSVCSQIAQQSRLQL